MSIPEVGSHFFKCGEAVLVGINRVEDTRLRVLVAREFAVVVFVSGFEGCVDARRSRTALCRA
ncbi:MAG: hypothetical protein R3C12_03990 [Planctomycetaceae bacterium]